MLDLLTNKKVQKYALYGVGSILVFILLAFIYQQVKKMMAQKRANDTLTLDETNLTISANQAVVLADRLETAMQGMGTANASIIDTLKSLKTPDDLALVIQKFGVRDNCSIGSFNCESGNLIDWIQWEFYGSGSYEPTGFGFASGLYWQQQLENELARLGINFENQD